MSKDDKKDYEVGYGKPPKPSRFKPGESGNPKGRPKKQRQNPTQQLLLSAFFDAAMKVVSVVENGVEKKMPAYLAINHQLVAKAAKGEYRFVRLFVENMKNNTIAAEDIQILFYKMIMAKEEADDKREEEEYWKEMLGKLKDKQ